MNPINATQTYAGHTAEAAYSRWAPIYDLIFDLPFHPGRAAAARAAAEAAGPGGEILVVGVGTGLSFGDYDSSTEIVGIDMCEPMVAKARERMASGLYPHVKDVQVMDAHELAFEDASFDCVVAQFVITLVANPERVLSECARVLRPGWRRIPHRSLHEPASSAQPPQRGHDVRRLPGVDEEDALGRV